MIQILVLLTISGMLLAGSIIYVRWGEALRLRQTLVTYKLRFPRELGARDVQSLVASLSGLLVPRWKRQLLGSVPVIFEMQATAEGIARYLIIPRRATAFVLGQLRASLPQVEAVEDQAHHAPRPGLARELSMTSLRRPLAVDRPEDISRALLASYQPLKDGEVVAVQWTVVPHAPVSPVKPAPKPTATRSKLTDNPTTEPRDPEAVQAARAKQTSPLFLAVGRVGSSAPTRAGQVALLRRVLGPLHITNAPGVHFRRRLLPSVVVTGRMVHHALPLVEFPCVLNSAEVTAVIGWPLGSPQIEGLHTARRRSFPPTGDIPTRGRVVALSTYPGGERPLALSMPDSLHHLWVVGPTGVGKSTLLGSLILQDIAAGRGVIVVDPKGDLVQDVLDRLPDHRVHDVVLLDPADDGRPAGLNPLAGAHKNPELVADQVLGIFHRLYRAFWGPRTQDILHAALLTLAQEPGSTLVDVPLLLTNDAFRRQHVGRLDDLVLEQFWAGFDAMSPGERAQAIGPVMNKLRQFLLRPRLRAVIGQPQPTFTLEEIIDTGKILLVSLPAGLLGDEASALIGSLIVAKLWQAIQARAAVPREDRAPALVYIDEFQTFVNLPTDLGSVLAQSRGLGVGFTLAHQHLAQLPAELRQAVIANARSKVIFQTAAGDAPSIARELGSPVEPYDLVALPAREVIMTLVAGGQVTPPVSGRTLAWTPPTGQGEAARAASRARYGRDRAEVDAAIRARQVGPRPTAPTTRRIRRRGGES